MGIFNCAHRLQLGAAIGVGVACAVLCWVELAPRPAAASMPAPQAAAPQPSVILPAAFGRSKPLGELAAAAQSAPPPAGAPRQTPRLRPQHGTASGQPAAPAAPDRALQPDLASGAMPSPTANFDGIPNVDGFYPPDTNGDIGYDPATGRKYYFEWINVRYEAWDVTDPLSPSVVVTQTLGNTLWASALPGKPCAQNNDGDPIALFDEQAHRWLISQFVVGASPNFGPFHQCVAVSASANPAGAWYVYDYQYLDGTTYFNDYPKFGVWPDPTYNAYFMSVNQFDNKGNNALGAGAAAFDRARMLAGDPAAPLLVFNLNDVNPSFDNLLPADLDGAPPAAGTPGFFFAVDNSAFKPALGADALRIWEFKPNWTTPASSTFGVSSQPNYTLPVTSFTMLPCVISFSADCIPQAGTTQRLDSLGDRLMYRAAFRTVGVTQSLVLNHTVLADGVDRAGIRWYELQRDAGTGAWSIDQQSTYAPADGAYRWMGSTALDKDGNQALGYSVSSDSLFPSIRYAGRLVTDTPSTLPQTEVTLTAGSGSQTGKFGRWGDYSMMAVDPQDGCTFWYTTEYVQVTGTVAWRTRIGSFRFPSCTSIATGSITGMVSDASSGNPISGSLVSAFDARGGTLSAQTDASGIYHLIGIPTGSYSMTASAASYPTQTVTGVVVAANAATTQDFALGSTRGVTVTPPSAAQTALPGSLVTYTLRVTNTGTLSDTFGISVTGNAWNTAAPPAVGPLAAGAGAGVTITVSVPLSATGTTSDTATITFTSQADHGKTAGATLTTRYHAVWLPLIVR